MRARTAALLLLPLLAACGSDVIRPGDYTLEGRWAGTADAHAFLFDFAQSAENDVSGTASVSVGATSLELDVSGDWEYPAFELLLAADDYEDVTFRGTFVTADSIDGTLSGSGFTAEALTIRRLED